jgi:hypothetical protein
MDDLDEFITQLEKEKWIPIQRSLWQDGKFQNKCP